MYKSSKFKFINNSAYNHYIPKIYNAKKILENTKVIDSSMILRSALKGEAQKENLKSGLSLTLKGINSHTELKDALNQIESQKELDEYILQDEVFIHTHLTVYIEPGFIFGEVTGTNEFFILSNQTHTGDKEIIQSILPLTNLIQANEKRNVLCEIGLGGQGDVFLFQLMEIENHPIKDYIKNDLFKILVQKKDVYLRPGFMNMLKTELTAYKVRKNYQKENTNNIEMVFFNWVSILHYFRLYCMQERITTDTLGWQNFLIETTTEKSWILKNALKHIRISSKLRQTEDMPEMPSSFKGEEKVFLGKGVHRLVVERDIQIITEMSLDKIKNLSDETRLVLSDYSSLLSHPCLLLIERNKMFIGGLSPQYLESLSNGDEVEVNFDKRSLVLISRKA